jgi:hypothetical protein
MITGELDCYHQIQVKQPVTRDVTTGKPIDSRVITTGSLTLLQNGFSRRSWIDLPADPYKSNGIHHPPSPL